MKARLHGTAVRRHGIVFRQVLLFLILVIVVGAGVYEFAYARPAFQAAWNEIQAIEESDEVVSITPEEIESRIGRQPFLVEEAPGNLEIRTYAWRSGLVFRYHVIRVVYTKNLPILVNRKPELADDRYFHSASANSKPELPEEKISIVRNLNPPQMAGGAPPAAGSDEGPRTRKQEPGDRDKADESPSGDGKSGDGDASETPKAEESTPDNGDEPQQPDSSPDDDGAGKVSRD